MSYNKYTWQTGETITADKLNHMEDGIASADGGPSLLVVHISDDEHKYHLDKTWQEINDAFPNVLTILEVDDGSMQMIQKSTVASVMMFTAAGETQYSLEIDSNHYGADSPTDYPHTGDR